MRQIDDFQTKYPELMQSALEEFSIKSYKLASLNNILTKINMSKGSFYHHIGDKMSLYLNILNYLAQLKFNTFRSMDAAYLEQGEDERTLKQKMKTNSEKAYQLFKVNPLFYDFYKKLSNEPKEFISKIIAYIPIDQDYDIVKWIKQAVIKGELRDDIDFEILLMFINNGLLGIQPIIVESCGNKDYSIIKDKIEKYIDLIFRAVEK